LNPLKRLAAQTAIYGISSIVGRFLNYLLVPLFTYVFAPAQYGVVSEFYAYMGFLAVLLVFGLETGYFRFRDNSAEPPQMVYATALRFLIAANLSFFLLVILLADPISRVLMHEDHPEYVWWTAAIVAMDSVGAVAFAGLRAENKALRFATIKVVEILVNVFLNLFVIVLCRQAHLEAADSFFGRLWSPEIGVGYIFLANMAASGVKLLLLTPQLRGVVCGFDPNLFSRMIRYALPMVAIGFAGIINEMLDRAALKYLLPYEPDTNLKLLGIYSACYKLSILMSLFIQAFRYAGEPFFFAHAGNRDAPKIYADVLTYFVIFCVFIFLLVTLYIDIFQYFIGKSFRVGLGVVPILLLANLFLGVYVNLSVWYKLTDRTLMGAFVALAGAAITIVLLAWWVPLVGYMGAAWATLICYASMALISYVLGRRYYPVPYDVKRCAGYVLLGIALYAANGALIARTEIPPLLSGSLWLGLYLAVAFWIDGRKLIARLATT
jgi:O-antigen/teichoic acid export membrane protein